MKRAGFKPLLFPALVVMVGLGVGQIAEYAVGYRQAYGFYGFARPVADLALIIGMVWLMAAAGRLLIRRLRNAS